MFLRVHIHSVKILGIDLIIIIIVFILPLRKNPLKSNISTHTNHTHRDKFSSPEKENTMFSSSYKIRNCFKKPFKCKDVKRVTDYLPG